MKRILTAGAFAMVAVLLLSSDASACGRRGAQFCRVLRHLVWGLCHLVRGLRPGYSYAPGYGTASGYGAYAPRLRRLRLRPARLQPGRARRPEVRSRRASGRGLRRLRPQAITVNRGLFRGDAGVRPLPRSDS